jgi:hypothetical protein
MKKIIRILLIITFLFLLDNRIIIGATAEENLKKAGEEALARYETQLKNLKKEIFKEIEESAKDGKISTGEMRKIISKLKKFQEIQKESMKWLKIYNLKISPDPEIANLRVNISKNYQGRLWWSDKSGKIRKMFAQITARDLEIESGLSALIIKLGLISGIVCVVVSASVIFQENKKAGVIGIITGILIWILIFLFA